MAYKEKERIKLVNEICELIEEENLSLRKACKRVGLPRKTFLSWISNYEEFRNQYAQACSIRAEDMFEDMLEIADKQDKDVKIVDGKEYIDYNIVHRNRLQVDTRKWALSKMMPKKYGDKLDLTTAGDKINKPPDFSGWSDEQIKTYLNEINSKKDE